jgi:ribulose-bisphosphate carboxylase large chain
MTLDRVPEMIEVYGNDLTLLIGGALHRGDLSINARRLVDAVASL